MNSDQIFDLLCRVNRQASVKAKVNLLQEHDCPALRAVLRAALDPFVRYNITWEESAVQVGRMESLRTAGTFDLAEPQGESTQLLRRLHGRSLTGNVAAATFSTTLACLNYKSACLLVRVVNKDLRCGVGITLANKAFPDLVPTFDVMLAQPFEARHVKRWPVAVEPKLDGIRVAVLVPAQGTPEDIQFLSRNGLPVTTLDHLREPVMRLVSGWQYTLHEDGVFLDCEVLAADDFNGTSSAIRRKDAEARTAQLHVFDFLPLTDFHRGCDMEYRTRRRELDCAFESLGEQRSPAVRLVPYLRAYSEAHVHQFYDEFRGLGYEGVIVKPFEGLYEKKRSRAFMKLKACETVDAPVVGVIEGTGKYEGTLGALVVDYKGVSVHVGSGLSDALRHELWATPPEDRLIEVAYHEVTPDGSLRHPRFVRFRDTSARIGDKV